MANNPIPDQSQDFIKSGMTLITDPKSDKYLNMVKRNLPPSDRFSRWCGGPGGFDDYVERM